MTPVTRVVTALRGIRATCLNAEPDGSLRNWLAEAEEALKEYDDFLHVEKAEPTVSEIADDLDRIQEEREGYGDKDVIIFLNGKDKPSFRCPCGCNVLKKHTVVMKYRCNACGEIFEGE